MSTLKEELETAKLSISSLEKTVMSLQKEKNEAMEESALANLTVSKLYESKYTFYIMFLLF